MSFTYILYQIICETEGKVHQSCTFCTVFYVRQITACTGPIQQQEKCQHSSTSLPALFLCVSWLQSWSCLAQRTLIMGLPYWYSTYGLSSFCSVLHVHSTSTLPVIRVDVTIPVLVCTICKYIDCSDWYSCAVLSFDTGCALTHYIPVKNLSVPLSWGKFWMYITHDGLGRFT